MRKNNVINNKIRKATLKYEKESAALRKKFEETMKELKKDAIKCEKEDYAKKYLKSRNELVCAKTTGCGEYVPKSDFYKILVEDYVRCTTFIDSGYGDDDCEAFRHVLDEYRVCKHCGRVVLLHREVLGQSIEWSRSDSEDCFLRAKSFIPDNWKAKIKII